MKFQIHAAEGMIDHVAQHAENGFVTSVRLQDGTVRFHKDGYTDLRGRFDYGPEDCRKFHDAIETEVMPIFRGALKRYPGWLESVDKDGLYFEQNNQELQVSGLNKGRFDVVLSDKSIFRYFELMLSRTNLFHAKAVQMHHFVEVNPDDYRPLFRSQQVRDDFNAGLAHLKASGGYQAIYDSYLK